MKQKNCPMLLQHKKNNMVVCFKTLTSGFVMYPGDTSFNICDHLSDLDFRDFIIFEDSIILGRYIPKSGKIWSYIG